MRNISPVVKDDDIEKKKHTHSVSDISDFPEIPDETAISGMGFTKNSGDYSKPNGGIPKSDLASAVQTSLSKADTALQEHQSLAEYVKADDARLTDARPANGGNAETVNGHTINADVPANAVFTDTTYEPATTSSDGLMSAADKKKLDKLVSVNSNILVQGGICSASSYDTSIYGGSYYGLVYFPKRFSRILSIVATSTNNNENFAIIYSVTESQAKILVRKPNNQTASTTTGSVYWIAIGEV